MHVATPEAALAAFAAGIVRDLPDALHGERRRGAAPAARGRRVGVVGVVPFVARYHPAVRAARARVAAGELGMLLTLDCSYLQDALLGADDSAPARGAAPRAPSRSSARTCATSSSSSRGIASPASPRARGGCSTAEAPRPCRGEDIAAVLVETDGGALGTVVVSQMAAGHPDALTLNLHGTASSLGFASERPGGAVGRRPGGRPLEGMDDWPATTTAFDAFLAAAVCGRRPLPAARRADPPRRAPRRDARRGGRRVGHPRAWVETPHVAA